LSPVFVAVIQTFGDHLKLTFVAEKPPPSRVFAEVALIEAEAGAKYL